MYNLDCGFELWPYSRTCLTIFFTKQVVLDKLKFVFCEMVLSLCYQHWLRSEMLWVWCWLRSDRRYSDVNRGRTPDPCVDSTLVYWWLFQFWASAALRTRSRRTRSWCASTTCWSPREWPARRRAEGRLQRARRLRRYPEDRKTLSNIQTIGQNSLR